MSAHNNLYQPFVKHISLFVMNQFMHKNIGQLFIFHIAGG